MAPNGEVEPTVDVLLVDDRSDNLAAIETIVEGLGGRIGFRSELGRGSTF